MSQSRNIGVSPRGIGTIELPVLDIACVFSHVLDGMWGSSKMCIALNPKKNPNRETITTTVHVESRDLLDRVNLISWAVSYVGHPYCFSSSANYTAFVVAVSSR